MLEINELSVQIEGKKILEDFNLSVKKGEIHAIMGPNGAGKSTLAKVIAGHEQAEIVRGDIEFYGTSILEMQPHERSLKGIFVSFQYPPEISGVTNREFLYYAMVARKPALTKEEFEGTLQEKMKLVKMAPYFADRFVNEGFSGGEKKRNEILQMALLEPRLAILDETDSGLDIDALRIISEGVNYLMNNEKGLILITHYQRLLDYIKPDYVHVMIDGKICESGDFSLAKELEKSGYGKYYERVDALI